MRATLQTMLDENRLTYEYLAYAYCKKQPNTMKKVEAFAWERVEAPLSKILKKQIRYLLTHDRDDDCYVGHYTRQPVALPEDANADVPVQRRTVPLMSVLQELLEGAAPEPTVNRDQHQTLTDRYADAMKLIAWKYLAQDHSQSAALCMIVFSAALPAGQRRFAFLSQVNLEEEKVEAVIDDETGTLGVKVLQNVFEERSLLKGALYPWMSRADAETFDPHQIYVHNQKDVRYWPSTLECARRKLSVAAERAAVLTVIRTVLSAETGTAVIEPRLLQHLAREATIHHDIGPVEVAAAAEAANQPLPLESVRTGWQQVFGAQNYAVDGQRAVGPDAKCYQVVAGDLKIVNVPPDLLGRMRQVNHLERRYLLIPLDESAKVRSDRTEVGKLPEITLAELDTLLRNPV